ncbi:MAG: zinc ribbon domain-containing protein [Lachnospiraceae bacterium]|nr:zinc ribbon domain-containing protein [Lachnospiraceae bacterium]
MAEQMKYCVKCGKQIRAGARFCNFCGYQYDGTANTGNRQNEVKTAANDIAAKAKNGANASGIASRAKNEAVSRIKSGSMNLTKRITASAGAGEMNFGALGDDIDLSVFGLAGNAGAAVTSIRSGANEILSPIKTLLSGIKDFGGNIISAVKDPKTMIPVVIMGILWFFLGTQRESESEIVKALSFLTFSEGGLDRDPAGMIGGVLGKGAVAAMFTSLVQGGGKNVVSGVKTMFSTFRGKEGKPDIVSLIIGIILGIAGYFIFVGINHASAGSAMAGIAGMVLSLKALGDKSSFLYRISTSIFSKVQNGIRVIQGNKPKSLLSGMSFGFALITLIFSVAK